MKGKWKGPEKVDNKTRQWAGIRGRWIVTLIEYLFVVNGSFWSSFKEWW